MLITLCMELVILVIINARENKQHPFTPNTHQPHTHISRSSHFISRLVLLLLMLLGASFPAGHHDEDAVSIFPVPKHSHKEQSFRIEQRTIMNANTSTIPPPPPLSIANESKCKLPPRNHHPPLTTPSADAGLLYIEYKCQ